MKEYAFYLGCIAPNRYPGAEAASYRTSERLGIKLLDLEGASCCRHPEPFGFDRPDVWYAMAARNWYSQSR